MHTFSFLLLLQTVYYFPLLHTFSFVLLQICLMFFFHSVQCLFFCCVNQRVTSIYTCSFSFFWRALFVFFFDLAYNQLCHISKTQNKPKTTQCMTVMYMTYIGQHRVYIGMLLPNVHSVEIQPNAHKKGVYVTQCIHLMYIDM